MTRFYCLLLVITIVFLGSTAMAQNISQKLPWPQGYKAALSLSFDDARLSQIDKGLAVLEKYDAKATFYVLPDRVMERLDGWKQAVAEGHEIGNHTLNHPCTENFGWVTPENATENYTLEKMRDELVEANHQIEELLGVTAQSFAYTCGETSVGRGRNNKSYIPLVAELFTSGRGWLGEAANNPEKVDFSRVLGMKMDDVAFEDLLPVLEEAKSQGSWVVLAGHEVGEEKEAYTTRISMLEKLLAYARKPENGIWLVPVGAVSEHIAGSRFNGSKN